MVCDLPCLIAPGVDTWLECSGQSVFPENLEFRLSIVLLVSTPTWDCTWDIQTLHVPSRGLSRELKGFAKLKQGSCNWEAMGSH